MPHTCSLLYSEKQGCFHHDLPDSKGDDNYKLLERGVSLNAAFCFAQSIYNLNPNGAKLSFDTISELWQKFRFIDISDDTWWNLNSFLVDCCEMVREDIDVIQQKNPL